MAQQMNIGIMPRNEYKQYTIDIAKGVIRPKENDPKIWFESVESMAQILSTRNQELLKTIKENNPQSLTELSTTSGRKLSNLSRTLKNMERYGIVELLRGSGAVKPRVCVDQFNAVFGFR